MGWFGFGLGWDEFGWVGFGSLNWRWVRLSWVGV